MAGAVDRYMALREFRARLYQCLTARPDALSELCDAILCADHAVTSLVQLSLAPEFRRGHGALYDALAAGQVDEEALAALLTGTLPQLVDGPEALAWVSEYDRIDYGLLEQALAGSPGQAAQVREACARWRRLRFAIDATPYPRPDAECSPGRGHVHHDAWRCDSTRKTIPGWEYQFTAALGHLRTAWAALVDVERTTPATRTQQTARQVKNLLRRLHAADTDGRDAPLVIMDAGYSAAALAGCDVHLLIRLASGQVFYADPVTWPGKKAAPPSMASPSPATTTPPRPIPNLMSPSPCPIPRATAPSGLMPGTRSTPSSTATAATSPAWDGELPVLRGTVLRVIVEHLPDGRAPHKTMWLWHAGPAPLSLDELWRAYLARFDEHAFRFAKGTLGLTAARVRPPAGLAGGSGWSWPPSPSCSWPGRSPLTCAAPGKPGPPRPPPDPGPGPPRVCKHPRPPGHPRPCR